MTMADQYMPNLINRLPTVRGKLVEQAPMAPMTWLKVGGPADILFKPADEQDLMHFLSNLDNDIPVTPIGVGSNMIIRDGGISGVVIRLGREFNYVDIDDTDNKNIKVTAGAATLDLMVAKMAMRRSAAGLEFFSGIPGSIGGAVRMNAGAYGQETKDVLIHATAIDRAGRPHELTPDDLNMTYRHTNLPDDWIVTKAVFVASPGDKELIKKEINQIQQSREESQPIREKTGGSTFANPPGEKAWKLIDAVGGRQLTIGGATMSDKHCNFMINTGHATAQDCEELGEELRRRVKDKFDITLRWEIKRIGRHQNSRRQDENGGNP